jgi:hypothetical protein
LHIRKRSKDEVDETVVKRPVSARKAAKKAKNALQELPTDDEDSEGSEYEVSQILLFCNLI